MFVRALTSILAFTTLFALGSAAAGNDCLPALVVVRELAPGESTDSIWSRPVSVPRFVNLKEKGIPTQRTEVRLAYDNASLYVAFRCIEDSMDKLLVNCTEHDGMVWRDDSVEVFLDTQRDGKTHFHLIANAAGTKFESRGKYPDVDSWNGEWRVDARREDGAWTALVTIPFESMGVAAPKIGAVWNAQFARSERPHGEMSSWSPVQGGFGDPESFGQMVFGGTDAPVVSTSSLEIAAPGRYQVTARISNPSPGQVTLRAEVAPDGRVTQTIQRTAASGDSEWQFDINFPYEGRHKLSIAFTDASSNEVVMRTPPVQVSIPPHGARLERYRTIVKELVPPNAAASKEIAAVRKALGDLVEFARTAKGSGVLWAHLGDKLDAVEKKVSDIRYVCTDKENLGYVVGAETPLRKVFRHRFFEGTLGEPARISAARNEYEAVQVVIIAYDKALEDVSVSVAPLTGPDGATIPVERLALNLVEYVETRKPQYEVDYVGWYPDPLMEMKPFEVPAGGIQPVWVTVHPAEDTPAGLYRGQITVKPANAPETTLPLEVRVWDFTLPREPHMKTAFALFEGEIGAWYGGMTEETRRAYYEFLLEHRINPTNIYTNSPVPTKEYLPFCIERGLNAFCLAYTHNRDDRGRAELADMIRDYESYLKEKGWWDKAYIYGFDEIPREKYQELRDMYGWLKEQFPDLPRACTVIPNEELKGYVDIWVPVTANYNQKDAEEYTKAGDEVWWYVCCNPHHPYANFFIDYPAIDPRILFWMNWKYRVPGFLYYALNLWTSNRTASEVPGERQPHQDPEVREAIKAGKRWPEIPWNTFSFADFNGDGHLIYPGPGGKPLSSIRFESIRDGIEDYEYFYILNDLLEKAEKPSCKVDPALLAKARKLLAVDDKVVKSVTEYTLDPEALLKARQDAAETIEKLATALGGE